MVYGKLLLVTIFAMLYQRSKASNLALQLTLVYIIVTLNFISAGITNAAATKITAERMTGRPSTNEAVTYRHKTTTPAY